MNIKAFQACTRFGLGARAGDLAAVTRDPQGYLLGQLKKPVMPPEIVAAAAGIDETAVLINTFLSPDRDSMKGKPKTHLKAIRKVYTQEVFGRYLAHVRTHQPFIERLVMFWSNHFTVSIKKPIVSGLVHRFEAEAIRPYITGKFSDMLKAVETHPAMLLYLDNQRSIGANSQAGRRRGKGINENLAREILELHTLGVDGGYTQADVGALARIITGWTLSYGTDGTVMPVFSFQPRMHEPGAATLLGKSYGGDDVNEGLAALDGLARHPSTARHIATKLARHFVSDQPPESAIAQLEKVFIKTDGDLAAIARTLVTMSECWADPLSKVKTPYEYIISICRMLGFEMDESTVIKSLETLNYRVFNASSPAGYGDRAEDWISADAVAKRLEWSRAAVTRMFPRDADPRVLAEQAFGPVMRDETRFILSGAESGRDALALLLVSPEFMRR